MIEVIQTAFVPNTWRVKVLANYNSQIGLVSSPRYSPGPFVFHLLYTLRSDCITLRM